MTCPGCARPAQFCLKGGGSACGGVFVDHDLGDFHIVGARTDVERYEVKVYRYIPIDQATDVAVLMAHTHYQLGSEAMECIAQMLGW